MSGFDAAGSDPETVAALERLVVAACEHFEGAWRVGGRPAIEPYLEGLGPAERTAVLRELIALEVELRAGEGDRPKQEEYANRFPDDTQVVAAAFASLQEATAMYAPTEGTLTGPSEGIEPLATTPGATGDRSRYRILRPHAGGGLGLVSVALDTELNREVAFKQIRESRADDPKSRARFLLEAEVTGNLEHPGIVPVYGLGHDAAGRPYYAMRFIKGESLEDAIKASRGPQTLDLGPAARSLTFRRLLQRFNAVCDAMDYAHSRGVLHGDLKPSNVMLGRYGETLVVDWGLARPVKRHKDLLWESPEASLEPPRGAGATRQGDVMGTPSFMSPEQALGRLDELGPTSDVYSLGATLYYLLTGREPFVGKSLEDVLRRVRAGKFEPPRRADPAAPAALEAVCLKAMALRPQDRYRTARALAADIENWLADQPVSAYREPVRHLIARWSRRHQARFQAVLVASVVVTLLSLAAAMLIVLARNDREVAYTKEREAHTRANESARLARQQVARLLFEQATGDLAAGATSRGWLRLAYALRQAADAGDRPLERAIRLEIGSRLTPARIPRTTLDLEAPIRSLVFSRDGTTVAAADAAGSVHQVPVAGGNKPAVTTRLGAVNALAYSRDGLRLFIATADGRIHLADAVTGHLEDRALDCGTPVVALGSAADLPHLFALTAGWEVHSWDLKTLRRVGKTTILTPPEIEVSHSRNPTFNVPFDASGKGLDPPGATPPGFPSIRRSGRDYLVRLSGIDVIEVGYTGEPFIHEYKINNEIDLVSVVFDPGPGILVTRSVEGVAQVWKCPFRPYTPHEPIVIRGGQHFTLSDSFQSHLSIETPIVSLQGPTDGATVRRLPGGRLAFRLDTEGKAYVMDLGTGKFIGPGVGPRPKVVSIASSPGGKHLATGDMDGGVKVWRVPVAVSESVERIDLSIHLWLDARLRDRPMPIISDPQFTRIESFGKFERTSISDPALQSLSLGERFDMERQVIALGGRLTFD